MISSEAAASELHVPVDGLHRRRRGERRGRRSAFGEAPAQSKSAPATAQATGPTRDPQFCENYHADDPAFWENVYYWNTPLADCGDDRGDVCKDYNDWVSAWTEIKG